MDHRCASLSSMGTDSQDSEDLVPPGTTGLEYDTSSIQLPRTVESPTMTNLGIKNAKKKLRAFSIQKKTTIAPVVVPKPVNTGTTTVLIGKLSSVKTTPKPEPEPDAKKIPKPPKPGGSRKNLQDSYTELQKRTLAEIEDMKRKMELVELGIPLGLIDPSSSRDKVMPTKAMPPIKSFLDATKVDELIREAKKARAEGKEFKFDYQKLLPDYDNPFQRKKDDPANPVESNQEEERSYSKIKSSRDRKESRKSDRYDRRHSDHKKDDRDKDRHRDKDKEKSKDKDRSKDKDKNKDKEKEKSKDKNVEEAKKKEVESVKEKLPKETDVNLNDYLVCDSWSLDNDDKNTASPASKVDLKNAKLQLEKVKQAANLVKETLKLGGIEDDKPIDSPKAKMEKLKPVIDSFKFEIDPNEDEALDLFDEDIELEKFARPTKKKDLYDSPIDLKLFDYDQDMSKEGVIDANDDNFLESVINEIKQENMSDDTSQEKGLVEYDLSPKDDYDDSKNDVSQGSVTPELDDKMRDLQSQQSNYSDSYRSTESGYTSKSTESGYKSNEIDYKEDYKLKKRDKSKDIRYRRERQPDDFRLSIEKELDDVGKASKMSRSTVDSLETWSFVLKICQPLLFRHDKNKCYKQTHVSPKLWFTENPKCCSCVKDRSVVYEELEMCKMSLVDRVYGCDQIPDEPFPDSRSWYPRLAECDAAAASLPLASDWETEDTQESVSKSLTPQHDGPDICLDREYQKFMEAVWPDVSNKQGESRSTTPVRTQETRKKKKAEETEEDRKKVKKVKLSSEGWSQESDLEEEGEKTKKIKQEKSRKRKHSSSSGTTFTESEDEIKKKKSKNKGTKKLKAKLAKKRRINKKLKKHLKDKQKKKKKLSKVQEVSDDSDEFKDKKKEKRIKKKKQLKQKKLQKKKKAKAKSSSSSSTSSTSSSDTESDEPKRKIKKKEVEVKKKKRDKKRRKQSSDSSQSEELFDVNVLNNIKTERLTDDEKISDFSPRRLKPREIINVKELQNDFVGSNIHIKQEKLDETERESNEDICSKMQEFAVEKPLEEEKLMTIAVTKPQIEHVTAVPTAIVPEQPRAVPPPASGVDDKDLIEQKKPVLEPMTEMVTYKIEESHMIPLPEDSIVTHNLEDIEMPPEKPIETIEPAKIKPISSTEYGFEEPRQSELYHKEIEPECEDKFGDTYEQDNYEMYEHMAMAYQSDVANQQQSEPKSDAEECRSQRIETVVRRRGEIKCDWRVGDSPAATHHDRPSRWGLKPGEVNIVLTGGPATGPPVSSESSGSDSQQFRIRSVLDPVYEIRSIANRTDNTSIEYDEAYMDTYGAMDRLQYGDCFAADARRPADRLSSLDERINKVLQETVLGEVAKETDDADEREIPDKGILVTNSLAAGRGKRVRFADGYRPGQDSDTEEPPVKKRKKSRRYGCAWPCPASHPDHVPLWDALPPPPPPASPPPPAAPAPPLHLLRRAPAPALLHPPHPHLPHHPHHPQHQQHQHALTDTIAGIKIDPTLPPFMPPEPPPGLINFQ